MPDTMSWHEATATPVATTTVAPDAAFASLGLAAPLVGVLASQGIIAPFPVQAATIPDALAGRDVLGRAQTGSGKTLGFGLPMLSRLADGRFRGARRGRAPRGLVLVPTRELAVQVADVLSPLAQSIELSTTLVAGGMAYGPQLKTFERGVDVVVATPGRLIDLTEQGAVDLSRIEIVVLDEADHMADLGFMPEVTKILDQIPAGGQRLLFSATLDRGVDKLVARYLSDPITHQVDPDQASVATMEHRMLLVRPHDKLAVTAAIANRDPRGRCLVFVRTQRGADRLAEQLREQGVTAGALHGGLTQGARSRILAAFKDGTVPVLVATDVAARGIHVDEVELVLQVDPPLGPKEYLHRAGRTARAGEGGIVVSLVLPHQRKTMRRITDQAKVSVPGVEVRPGEDKLAELTGARTPQGRPVDEETYRALIAPPARPSARAKKGAGHGGPRRGPARAGSGKGGAGPKGSGKRGPGHASHAHHHQQERRR